MAELCSSCADRFHELVDINIEKIFSSLGNRNIQPTLCEGCGLIALWKDDEGVKHKGYSKRKTIQWIQHRPDLI